MPGLKAGGIFNFLLATDTAAGQAKLNRDLKRKQRAENEASASAAGLARWSQSLSNQKLMDQAGKDYGTISENLARQQDSETLTTVQRTLMQSEKLGAATAALSAAGLGGSSAETYKRTMETSYALQSEAQDRSFKSSNYLMIQQRGDIISDAVDRQGRDVISANFDFTNYGATKAPSLVGNLAALGIAAAASAAGAPDVGNAILSARTAGLRNRSGDGQGAQKAFGNALDELKSGVGQLRDTFRFHGGSNLSPVDTTGWGDNLKIDLSPQVGMSSTIMR